MSYTFTKTITTTTTNLSYDTPTTTNNVPRTMHPQPSQTINHHNKMTNNMNNNNNMNTMNLNLNHHPRAPRRWQPNRRRSYSQFQTQPRHNRIHYDRSKQPKKPYQPLPRHSGTLKFFLPEKKYGFIQYHDATTQSTKEVFVHQTEFIAIAPQNIAASIGQSVQFNLRSYTDHKTGAIREKAQNVRVLTANPQQNQSETRNRNQTQSPTKPPMAQSNQ